MKNLPQLDDITLDTICDKLERILPHGSGIDGRWEIKPDTHGNIIAANSVHCMNGDGYYDGWLDFKVKFFRVKEDQVNALKGPCEGQSQILFRAGDWDMKITFGPYKRNYIEGWRDRLYEQIDYLVKEAKIFEQFGMRSHELTLKP